MATLQPPSFLQNRNDHSAAGDRLAFTSIVSVPGVIDAAHLKVTQASTPNMTVRVAAGRCFIGGTLNAYQGTYHCTNDATVNVTISPASASFPRKDLIIARVNDSFYAGSINSWTLEAIAGTPATTPVLPVVPANSIVLAEVSVAANDTTIVTADIIDRRPMARTSLLTEPATFTSTTRPVGFAGQMGYETDTKNTVYYDGTNWQTLAKPMYDTGVRNVHNNLWLNGGTTSWGGSLRVQRFANMVFLTGHVTANSGGAFIGLARNGTAPVTIDTGFRPMLTAYPLGLGTANTNGGSCDVIWDPAVNRIKLSGAIANWSVNNFCSFALSWTTSDLGPATLPGTAA